MKATLFKLSIAALALSTGIHASSILRSAPNVNINAVVDEPSSSSSSYSSSIGQGIKNFLKWPIDAFAEDTNANAVNDSSSSAHPLLSQKLFNNVQVYADSQPSITDGSTAPDNALFSFKLSKSASRRYDESRRRRLQATATADAIATVTIDEAAKEEEELGPNLLTMPIPDPQQHDMIHEMVVHVTYEDVCESIRIVYAVAMSMTCWYH